MTEKQKKVLEGLIANDQHPERGEIKLAKDIFGYVSFERLTPNHFERWYDNGQLNQKCLIKDGESDGLYEKWHKNGQLFCRGNYINGRIEGTFEEWYENGQLMLRCNYKKGLAEGLREVWHPNGQMSSRCEYKEGKRDGLDEYWYPSGELRCRSNFKDDKRHGLEESWYRNGQLRDRYTYKEGKIDGLAESWNSDGQLESRGSFKNGVRDGLQEEANADGKVIQSIYNDGVMLSIKMVDKFSDWASLQVAKCSEKVLDKEIEAPTCRFLEVSKPSSLTQKVNELGATLPNHRSGRSPQTKAVKNSKKFNKL